MAGSFIGYMELDAWAEAVNRQQPVYACAVNQTTSAQGVSRTAALVVMCAQVTGNADIHYCRIVVGEATYIGESAIETDYAARMVAQRQVFELVRQWLVEKNFTLQESMPDTLMPNPYRSVVDCWPKWLMWDSEAKKFCRQN